MAETTTTASAATTAELVRAYGDRLAPQYATTHTVLSPLGIYVLLALLAPAAAGEERARLENVLGTSADVAAARVADLLVTPHPAVRAAVAVWQRMAYVADAFRDYAARLPATVECADMPDQAGADAWASDRTMGMIERFPLQIDDRTAIVLASALATDVSWAEPFEVVSASDAGGAPDGLLASVEHVLQSVEKHEQRLVETAAAGVVGVHVGRAVTGLSVVSVVAGADVDAAAVHAGAAEVASYVGDGTLGEHTVSLFDLPLGDGACWTLTEQQRELRAFSAPPRMETYVSYLPAWRSHGDHDLATAPGVRDALRVMESYVRPQADPPGSEARQSAVAEYTRFGFKAAAVTAFGVRATALPSLHRVTERVATIRFDRPYAVVALAGNEGVDDTGRRTDLGVPAWSGLPVFTAWVAEAVDAATASPPG
jgi:hypothetical protein